MAQVGRATAKLLESAFLNVLFVGFCSFGLCLLVPALLLFFCSAGDLLFFFTSYLDVFYGIMHHTYVPTYGVSCFGNAAAEDPLSPALRVLLVGPFQSPDFEATLLALKLDEVAKFQVYDDVEDLLVDRRAAFDVPFDEGLIRRFWQLVRRSPDAHAQEQSWRRSRMRASPSPHSLGLNTSPSPRLALPTPLPSAALASAVAGRGDRRPLGSYARAPPPPALQLQTTPAEAVKGQPTRATRGAAIGPAAPRPPSFQLPCSPTTTTPRPHSPTTQPIQQGISPADTLRNKEAARLNHWSTVLLTQVAEAGPAATINAQRRIYGDGVGHIVLSRFSWRTVRGHANRLKTFASFASAAGLSLYPLSNRTAYAYVQRTASRGA